MRIDRTRHVHRASAVTIAVVAAVFTSTAPLFAHTAGHTSSFAEGVFHPLGGLDHLVAMVAVGIVATVGTTRGLHVAAAPLAFVGAMVIGGAIGLAGWGVPSVELLILGSVVALGIAIAAAGRPDAGLVPPWLLMPLVAIAGVAHGNAHGNEAAADASAIAYVAGFVVVTALLHGVGLATGALVRRRSTVALAIGVAMASAGVTSLI